MENKLTVNQIRALVERGIMLSPEVGCFLLNEIDNSQKAIANAENVIAKYADEENWSDTANYEEENYRSIDVNGCPDSYQVEICLGDVIVWTGENDGPEIAKLYFQEKEDFHVVQNA